MRCGCPAAESLGPINFESGYTAGDVDGQNGWSKTGSYDAAVANVSSFPAASGYGFGTKALRISDVGFRNSPRLPGFHRSAAFD